MTDEQRAMATALVKLSTFRFLPGMMLADSMGWSISQEDADGFNQAKTLGTLEDTLPDLSDETTVMSLLWLVKDALKGLDYPGYFLYGSDATGYQLLTDGGGFRGATELHCFVAALAVL